MKPVMRIAVGALGGLVFLALMQVHADPRPGTDRERDLTASLPFLDYTVLNMPRGNLAFGSFTFEAGGGELEPANANRDDDLDDLSLNARLGFHVTPKIDLQLDGVYRRLDREINANTFRFSGNAAGAALVTRLRYTNLLGIPMPEPREPIGVQHVPTGIMILGGGVLHGNNEVMNVFDGDFISYSLHSEHYLTEDITKNFSFGYIDGDDDLGPFDGFYLDGGVTYYVPRITGLPDIALDIGGGVVFLDDQSDDVNSFTAGVRVKPLRNFPLTAGLSYRYSEFNNIKSDLLLGTLTVPIGPNMAKDQSLAQQDRDGSVDAVPPVIRDFYLSAKF